jgi:cytoskeletal protein CcmA (bactofilin family)
MSDDKETFLDQNAVCDGKLEGSHITLRGRFKGELRVSGVLRVLGGSNVDATVTAGRVEIDGRFQGDIRADSLKVFEHGRATGTFRAKTLSVKEGAKLDGKFEIGGGPADKN